MIRNIRITVQPATRKRPVAKAVRPDTVLLTREDVPIRRRLTVVKHVMGLINRAVTMPFMTVNVQIVPAVPVVSARTASILSATVNQDISGPAATVNRTAV